MPNYLSAVAPDRLEAINRRGIARTEPMRLPMLVYFLAIAMVALLPLGFIPLTALGLPFLTPPHLLAVMIVLSAPLLLPGTLEAGRVLRTVLAAYVFKFTVLFISLSWSPYQQDGAVLLAADFGGAFIAALAFLQFSKMNITKLAKAFGWGAFLGVIALHGAIFLGHALSGRFSLSILFDALAGGEFRALKTQYFVGALNGLGIRGAESLFSEIAPKATNAFGSVVITPMIAAVHLAYAHRKLARGQSALPAPIIPIIFANAVLCVLIAFSDRVTLYAGIILLTHLFYFGFFQGNYKVRFVISLLAAIAGGLLAILLADNVIGQGGIGEFVQNFLDNPRFNDLRYIFMRLGETPLYGNGLGIRLGLDYRYPHNVFMSDYFSAGIMGLAGAVVWFGTILYFVISAFSVMVDRQSTLPEQRVALAALTILLYNLALTQLTGQGTYDLGDWLGFAAGLLLVVKVREMKVARLGASSERT